jgi:hypothetical protein
MIRRPRRAGLVAAACCVLAHAACSFAPTTASYYVAAPLVAVDGSTAAGRFEAHLSILARSLYAEVEGLVPDATYGLALDGDVVASFDTDAAGVGWVGRQVDGAAQDPRGRRISVLDADGHEVLLLADASDPRFVEMHNAPLASFGAGGGHAQLVSRNGRRTLRVELLGAGPGVYDVVVDGTSRTPLDAPDGSGRAALVADDVTLESAIEIQLDGGTLLAGSPNATIVGLDWCFAGHGEQPLVSWQLGSGHAALSTFAYCGRRFDVEIRDVAPVDYQVWIDGVMRGWITVGTDENGVRSGRIAFTTDETGAKQLDFDPVGAAIEVYAFGVLQFSLDAFQPQ